MNVRPMFWDELGRPLMPCCGAPILAFRLFQCVHDYEARR